MNKHLEIFEAKFNKFLSIVLTVEFIDRGDFYIIKSRKFKIEMESSSNKIKEARKEFVEVFNSIIKFLINKKELFKELEFLGFKIRPYGEVMKEKVRELTNGRKLELDKKANKYVEVDQDSLMYEPFINFNRVEPSVHWQTR